MLFISSLNRDGVIERASPQTPSWLWRAVWQVAGMLILTEPIGERLERYELDVLPERRGPLTATEIETGGWEVDEALHANVPPWRSKLPEERMACQRTASFVSCHRDVGTHVVLS